MMSHLSRNILRQFLFTRPCFSSHQEGFHTTNAVREYKSRGTPKERYAKTLKYRFVPSRYRVALSAHQEALLKKSSQDPDAPLWSDGTKNHPLPDNPYVEYPQPLPDGGLKYYGFEYYPRVPGEVENLPKEEISPLFMVKKEKPLHKVEWFLRDIMEKLGLGFNVPCSEVVIVKNIPEMNAILYAVKHLITITPIKLPADLPLDADPRHCFLTEEGEFSYEPSLAVDEDKLRTPPEIERTRLDVKTVRDHSFQKYADAWDLIP